ncbi:TPA: alkyl hydroperoxide reductase [Elizabethkingia anophelis]|uniref:alkyl hydroperoxide reductase n=1 Tax=Elizabethkingia anophelis TaxID=1117645 RepID=UPI0037340E22
MNILLKKTIAVFLFVSFVFGFKAQSIQMYFPHFAGKTYDFVFFQGAEAKTIIKGTIPLDGKFSLTIPQEYKGYTGMSRWLITGTKEGGGLDMFIPGHDFSVSCEAAEPNDKNIVYTDNNGNSELNTLYRKQEEIIQRFETMQQAISVFPKTEKNYNVFKQELLRQQKAFETFHIGLEKNTDYISHFIPVINITRGTGNRLYTEKKDTAANIENYITRVMDWKELYTSGHWSTVIDTWLMIHTAQLNDVQRFVTSFKSIRTKLGGGKFETEFIKRVIYMLNENKATEYTKALNLLNISSNS